MALSSLADVSVSDTGVYSRNPHLKEMQLSKNNTYETVARKEGSVTLTETNHSAAWLSSPVVDHLKREQT